MLASIRALVRCVRRVGTEMPSDASDGAAVGGPEGAPVTKQRASLALLIGALRVATLRLADALLSQNASINSSTSPVPSAQLHELLLGQAHSFIPLPLGADPLLLRWAPHALFSASSLHPPPLIERMHHTDAALAREARRRTLPVLAPPPEVHARSPDFAALELLLHGRAGGWRAEAARIAKGELRRLEGRSAACVQAAYRERLRRRRGEDSPES